MYFIKKVLMAFLLFYSITVYALPNSKFAVGSYDAAKKPIVLKSDDEGKSWHSINNFTNSPNGSHPDNLNFKQMKCKKNICIAVGGYWRDQGGVSIPVLLFSKDDGKSWTFIQKIDGLPPNLHNGSYKSIDCTDKACIAVGSTWYGALESLPLIVRFNIEDASWSLQKISGNEINRGRYNLNNVNCQANTCFIVGELDDNKSYPLILKSVDDGIHWTEIKDITGVPTHNVPNYLTTINCVDHVCTAAGLLYQNPLFLVSNNHGDSWSYIEVPGATSSFHKQLSNMSCNENNCIIAATMDRSNYSFNDPAFFVTHNGGQTWSFNKKISNLPWDWKSGSFNSISCSKSICAAVGSYYCRRNQTHPFVVTSTDSGNSWKFLPNILDDDNGDEGDLSQITCQDDGCIIVGAFYNSYKKIGSTMLLSKINNAGDDWKKLNISGLPNDLDLAKLDVLS